METELEELRLRIGRLEDIVAKIGPKKDEDGRTHLARVLDVLAHAGWLTAAEIADRAGIDSGSSRMVLYTNKELFTNVRISAGRVKWQISPLHRHVGRVSEGPQLSQRQG